MDNWITAMVLIFLGISSLLYWINKMDKENNLGRYKDKLKKMSDNDIIDEINDWTSKR